MSPRRIRPTDSSCPWSEQTRCIGVASRCRHQSTNADADVDVIEYRRRSGESAKEVHILGAGAVGKFIGHALRTTADPPDVTFLLHRPYMLTTFLEEKSTVELMYHGGKERSTGYKAELCMPFARNLGDGPDDFDDKREHLMRKFADHVSDDRIDNLIVTVKSHSVLQALKPLIPRLDKDSTIMLLQNGMGTLEEINRTYWPDPTERPNYVIGINSHGLNSSGDFQVEHAGQGIISMAIQPRPAAPKLEVLPNDEDNVELPEPPRYLIQIFARTPLLAAVPVSPIELQQLQLEKLVANCIINPLTCLLDCRNGDLLDNHAIGITWRLLLAEICAVILSMPELQHLPNLRRRFAHQRLESIVVNIAKSTALNLSSMVQDMRRGSKTEVEYLNGYIVQRGEEMGIKCVMNYMLMHMVKGKQMMISREVKDWTPFRDIATRPSINL